MNPESSLTRAQIEKVFEFYNLAKNPKIERINIGFTNELYQVDKFILKISARQNHEAKFNNEVELYKRLQGRALVPKFVVADNSHRLIKKSFMIYEKIPGESLGGRWHNLTDKQRREIVNDLCGQLRIVSQLETNPKLTNGQSWQELVLEEIRKDLQVVERKKLLSPTVLRKIKNFLDASSPVLEKEKLALFYWDIHLDNIIVDSLGKMVGLIDFEHVSVVSLDYPLEIIRQIQNYPWLSLALEMEKYADKKDYTHLMDWFHEFYPQLFDFPELNKRLDFYELQAILRKLSRFPKAQQLHERLARIVA